MSLLSGARYQIGKSNQSARFGRAYFAICKGSCVFEECFRRTYSTAFDSCQVPRRFASRTFSRNTLLAQPVEKRRCWASVTKPTVPHSKGRGNAFIYRSTAVTLPFRNRFSYAYAPTLQEVRYDSTHAANPFRKNSHIQQIEGLEHLFGCQRYAGSANLQVRNS